MTTYWSNHIALRGPKCGAEHSAEDAQGHEVRARQVLRSKTNRTGRNLGHRTRLGYTLDGAKQPGSKTFSSSGSSAAAADTDTSAAMPPMTPTATTRGVIRHCTLRELHWEGNLNAVRLQQRGGHTGCCSPHEAPLKAGGLTTRHLLACML